MAVVMIDKQAADLAMRRIRVGDRISATFNEKRVTYMVLEKPTEGYILRCQSSSNKVSMGIACTDIYKEELEKMRIDPETIEDKPRGRGRPPGSTKTKAAEVQSTAPGNTYLPPGSDWSSAPKLPAPPYPTKQEVAAIEAAAKPAPIELAEGNGTWLQDALDTAMGNFKTELEMILEAMGDSAEEREAIQNEAAPAPKTCGACIHVELDGTPTCMKYNGSPPLSFVLNAQAQCAGFEELPM